MINDGMFIDRFPCIRAAGKIPPLSQPVKENFKWYNKEELAEFLVKSKKKDVRQVMRHGVSKEKDENELNDILSPELKKSRFVAFVEKFSEDMYFKKPELGKCTPTNSKPDHITNENTTFGIAMPQTDSAYELIFPRKTPDEVNTEYAKWHDKYIISHNHYFPSERIRRWYDPKYFNPLSTFGITTATDTSGVGVRRCMNHPEQLLVISKAQKYHYEKNHGCLGKKIVGYHLNIDETQTMGHPSRFNKCNVKMLLENIDPCRENTELVDAISYINKMRQAVFTKIDFHVHDLKSALESIDMNGTGFLPLRKIVEAAGQLHVRLNEEKIRTALKHFNLIEDCGLETERVNYDQFVKLLQIQIPLPKIGNLSVMPDVIYNKDTTYRDLCKDLEKGKTEQVIEPQVKHFHGPKVEKTTAKDVISPDIPMHFGLGPSDFEQPRTKQELQRIFKRIVTTDKFDKVWEKACEHLKPHNDMISIDDFRAVLDMRDN